MINETLRNLVALHGVNQVLANLADICKQEAEEDPMMTAQWLRTARKLLKLSLEIPDL